jgi:hypothetical protein
MDAVFGAVLQADDWRGVNFLYEKNLGKGYFQIANIAPKCCDTLVDGSTSGAKVTISISERA